MDCIPSNMFSLFMSKTLSEFEKDGICTNVVYPMDIINIMLKKGNYEDPFNSTHKAIIELICEIRKLDELAFHQPHPVIDEILKVDDYTLNTQWNRLNELYIETKARHHNGIFSLSYKVPEYFSFKFQDKKGIMHMVNCDLLSLSLAEVTNAIVSRLEDEVDQNKPLQIMYKRCVDVEHDYMIVIASDSDIKEAVNYAISKQWMVLKLHLAYSAKSSCVIQRGFVVALPIALGLGVQMLRK